MNPALIATFLKTLGVDPEKLTGMVQRFGETAESVDNRIAALEKASAEILSNQAEIIALLRAHQKGE